MQVVHDARMRPDLHSMYLRHSTFTFDRVFSERSENDELYAGTAGPLVRRSVEGGIATVFMFGQTGSGKTYTMSAIHERACRDIFELAEASDSPLAVFLTYIELSGDRCKDMLNKATPVKMLTDAEGEVHLRGVVEARAAGHDELHRMIVASSKLRATAATGVHDQSSRSHALCRVTLRRADGVEAVHGSFTMVDLAGTERNQDSLHHDAKLRKETTEINRSLMALKDCVRERAQGASHISFRKDKLTQLLKSCFTMPEAYTVVIATVSPSCSDTEHTLSTLQHSSQMDGQTTDCAEVVEEDLAAPVVKQKPKRKPGVGSGSRAAAASSKRLADRTRAPRKARLDSGDSLAKTAGGEAKASSRRVAIAVPEPAGKAAAPPGSRRPRSAGSKEQAPVVTRREPITQGQSRVRRQPAGNAGATPTGPPTAATHKDRANRTDFGRRSLNALQEQPLETVDESQQASPREHHSATSRLDRRARPKPGAPQLSARTEQEYRTDTRPVNKSQQRRDEKAAKERARRASSVPHQRSQQTSSSEAAPEPSRLGSNTRPSSRFKTSPASSNRTAAPPDSGRHSARRTSRASGAASGSRVATAGFPSPAWGEESPGAAGLPFTEEEIEALARQQLQQRMKEIKLDLENQGKVEESQSLPSFGPDSAGGRGNRGKGQTLGEAVGAGSGSSAASFSARGHSYRRPLGDDAVESRDRGARTARESRDPNAHTSVEQLRELGTCKVGDTYRVMKQVRVRAGPELDSPRLSVLGGGEIVTVLETWQSREGQLRIRCDAGWTSIYSKDGQTRLLQRTATGSRSPPGRAPSSGRAYSARGSSSPPADAESSPYRDAWSANSVSPSRTRSPVHVVTVQASPERAGGAAGRASELPSPIRTDVPLPLVEDAALFSPREPELVVAELGADELAAGAPPIVGADASLAGGSPGRGHGTPEIPLPSVASPQRLPPPLAPA